MPSLKETVNNDLKQAMRHKDEFEVSVLRMLLAALKNKEIALGKNLKSGLNSEEAIETVKSEIIDFLRKNDSISIQKVRELFGFSRKHILPLLSRLDEERVTRRQGDERVLVKK